MKKQTDKRLVPLRDLQSSVVRLLNFDGSQLGVVSIPEALAAAAQAAQTTGEDLELVVISPTAEPPVCKIMDKGKFLYELNKKAHVAKKKQKQVQIKEIKIRPATEEADFQVKLNNIKRFLENGDKVKITVRFRGRELMHNDLGMAVIQRFEKELADLIMVEQTPKMEGRQIVMMIAPKRKK